MAQAPISPMRKERQPKSAGKCVADRFGLYSLPHTQNDCYEQQFYRFQESDFTTKKRRARRMCEKSYLFFISHFRVLRFVVSFSGLDRHFGQVALHGKCNDKCGGG
jgi:hypothetical protein